jgi:hypothetical protein
MPCKDCPAGISELKELQENIYGYVRNEEYDGVFQLLPIIRLYVINPLIYLSHSLERYYERHHFIVESLDTLIKDYWETLNLKLIKFSIAHKKLDAELIASRVRDVILKEEEVLNSVLEHMTVQSEKINM